MKLEPFYENLDDYCASETVKIIIDDLVKVLDYHIANMWRCYKPYENIQGAGVNFKFICKCFDHVKDMLLSADIV